MNDDFYIQDESLNALMERFLQEARMLTVRARNAENGATVVTHVNSPLPAPLMTPNEVARAFHVDPKTVTRWAVRGLLPCVRTPGGHRRFNRKIVEELTQERYETSRQAQDSETGD